MRCMNWIVCHNEVKPGRALCQHCIDEALRMDDPERQTPRSPRHMTREERQKLSNEHKRGER